VSRYRPLAPGLLIIGGRELNLPFFAGTLMPSVDITVFLSSNGAPIAFDANALRTLPRGAPVWFQAVFQDNVAAQGVAMSHGIKVMVP
jgi:hypothetical protein